MTVDTLSLAQKLREAELSSTQAEAIATAIGQALIEGAATKQDLQQVKVELESKIDSKVEQLRSSLLLWFVGTQIAIGALIVALVKL